MGKMKNLYIEALNAAAEAEQKAYCDFFNSATEVEENWFINEDTSFMETDEYLDSEDDGGYYR